MKYLTQIIIVTVALCLGNQSAIAAAPLLPENEAPAPTLKVKVFTWTSYGVPKPADLHAAEVASCQKQRTAGGYDRPSSYEDLDKAITRWLLVAGDIDILSVTQSQSLRQSTGGSERGTLVIFYRVKTAAGESRQVPN